MENADIRAIAEGLADKIDLETGEGEQVSPGEWRILSRIGARRETALGAEGVDETLEIDPGPGVAGEIERFLIERVRVHHSGPQTYLYAVLRRKGRAGNVAVSPPIRVGGGDADAHSQLASFRDQAISALAAMAPHTLQLLERITVRALGMVEVSRSAELEAKVLMAQLVGRAEAGDDGARWEAVAQSAQHFAPVAAEAINAWKASMGVGAPAAPTTAEQGLEAFRSWPQAARDAVIRGILEELAAEQAKASGAHSSSGGEP
jgi:hypothetical protein